MKRILLFFVFTFCGVALSVSVANSADQAADKSIDLCSRQAVEAMDYFLDHGGKKSEVFRVNNRGELEITGKQLGYLATKEKYRNFTIRGEYSFPNSKIETNSGFLVRVTGPSPIGTFLPRCVELQIMRGLTGDLFGFHGLVIKGDAARYVTGKKHEFAGDYCHVKKFRNVETPLGTDWNTFEITCFEDLVVVRVNGELVNWATGVENVEGTVAFQSEGGPALFRNVTLTPLQ
ncbi:MAG: DUF1080 domain-containing protein [Planctomycetia bacterium]|nr:DUF1080 domain-containing protein [Planctomycetia bacterium]